MPKGTQFRSAKSGSFVTIDRNFVRAEAREAVRQFFRPITAPFELARDPERVEPARADRNGERSRR